MIKINSAEITPEYLYLSRRRFMVGVGALVANSLVLAACARQTPSPVSTQKSAPESTSSPAPPTSSASAPEGGLTSLDAITNYTNFYEFTTDKQGVASLAQDFITSPWAVEVGGLVHNPKTFDIDDLRKFEQEERIYESVLPSSVQARVAVEAGVKLGWEHL